ncbi:hypothetical protein DPV78_004029 [Talaromyces pinophilus]|nr:hypothetical protein DPV78_004029 [Talaromyces pinophilus]
MKFITSALLLLLPFAAVAAPAPDSAESRSVAPTGEEIFDKRAEELCSIINVSTYVNCRSGPGTGYSVVTTFKEGEKWYYSCYEPGTCTEGNCTWDWNEDWGCYVNGYYTSANCSKANLGLCY